MLSIGLGSFVALSLVLLLIIGLGAIILMNWVLVKVHFNETLTIEEIFLYPIIPFCVELVIAPKMFLWNFGKKIIKNVK